MMTAFFDTKTILNKSVAQLLLLTSPLGHPKLISKNFHRTGGLLFYVVE